ncbi:hypothetical protein [Streptomyces sp. Ac-502]|uniref:hypothetical protein n=1 Tax=Streptomyces sp. Ac-502 TaxID=3342801 RepID=UPI0038629EE2
MMSALPPDRAGTGSGLQSLARELGSALGIAISGSIVTALFTARLPAVLRGPHPPTTVAAAERELSASGPAGSGLRDAVLDAFTGSLDAAMLVLAAVVVAGGALVVAWYPGRRSRTAAGKIHP